MNTFRLVERADRFRSAPIEHSLATPSALRGDLRKVPSARHAERISMGHHPCSGLAICLLLEGEQPLVAGANLECVILALSSLPGTIGHNFLRLRRAEALHLILLYIHRGPRGPPLSQEAAGCSAPGHSLLFNSATDTADINKPFPGSIHHNNG